MKRLLIGLCTYQRKRALMRCLGALAGIDRPDGLTLLGVVVDNDLGAEKDPELTALLGRFPYPFAYQQVGGGRNKARNAVLEYAVGAEVDYIALCDDDSCAPKDWLVQLYGALRHHQADVLTGPLVLCAPAGTSAAQEARYRHWLRLQAIREVRAVRMARASNVLFKAYLVRDLGLRFAEHLIHHGEDTDFFMRAWQQGARLYETPDAPIAEHWPRERLRFAYFVKRHFWIGYYTPPIAYSVQGVQALPALLAQALWKLCKGLVQSALGWCKKNDPYGHSLKGLLLCARAAGLIVGMGALKAKNRPA